MRTFRLRVLCGLLTGALITASAWAQPRAASQEAHGDPGQGHFGDAAKGHFGDPGRGEFQRYNFNRSQEGQVPVLPGAPRRFEPVPAPPRARATDVVPTPEAEPYFVLQAPLDPQ